MTVTQSGITGELHTHTNQNQIKSNIKGILRREGEHLADKIIKVFKY